MSPPEARMWDLLRRSEFATFHFRRQVPLGPYYADFASHSAQLVIEVDGGTHFAGDARGRDAARDAFIAAEGYRVMRFTTVEILGEVDSVYRSICAAVGLDA
jgi:very-short-patch-repair endonuclease